MMASTQLDDAKYSAGDHNILLEKLDYYVVRGIANEWFLSYLKNRKQFVPIGGHTGGHSGNSGRCSTGFCSRTPPFSIIYK